MSNPARARLEDRNDSCCVTPEGCVGSARATVCSRRAADKRATALTRRLVTFNPLPAVRSLLEFYMHQDRTVFLQGQRFTTPNGARRGRRPSSCSTASPATARTWDDEAGALASRYRVLALDQRAMAIPTGRPTATTRSPRWPRPRGVRRHPRARAPLDRRALDGGRVAIAFAGQHRSRVDRLVVVDIGPDISEAGRVRVGTLLAQTPELFTSLEEAIAFGRATSPRYTEAMLRHRVPARHTAGAGASPGSTTARCVMPCAPGSGVTRSISAALARQSPAPSCSCAAPTPTVLSLRSPSRCSKRIRGAIRRGGGAGHTVPGDQPARLPRAPGRIFGRLKTATFQCSARCGRPSLLELHRAVVRRFFVRQSPSAPTLPRWR